MPISHLIYESAPREDHTAELDEVMRVVEPAVSSFIDEASAVPRLLPRALNLALQEYRAVLDAQLRFARGEDPEAGIVARMRDELGESGQSDAEFLALAVERAVAEVLVSSSRWHLVLGVASGVAHGRRCVGQGEAVDLTDCGAAIVATASDWCDERTERETLPGEQRS